MDAVLAEAWNEIVRDQEIKRATVTGAFGSRLEGRRHPAHIGEAVTIRGLRAPVSASESWRALS